MKKFKVSFEDIFYAKDEDDAIAQLLTYLSDCARLEDVTGFGVEEIVGDNTNPEIKE